MATTAAQRNRKIRQDALREQLSKQKHVEKLIDIAEKVTEPEFKNEDLPKYRLKADIHLSLIKKYLPDLKAMEITGDADNPVTIEKIERTIVSASDTDR
jgi:hypothetical protein